MTKKKCKKGWGCGNSCISRTRKCRSNTNDEGKKLIETFSQYINRTQEPGEMTGPLLPTVAIAKEADISKFNSIAQDIIKPPPIKPLTPEEEALVVGEDMKAARGYNDMLKKADRIRLQNPDITQAEAEALAQYIHHTYYSDMNRVLYMNNLELQENGLYNVDGARSALGRHLAPRLVESAITDEVLEPRPSKVKKAEKAKIELAELQAQETEEFSLDNFLAQQPLKDAINAGKSIAEHQADWDEILEDSPEALVGQTFAQFVKNRGGDVRKGETFYSQKGVETMKAVDKAFKNSLHKLDKATPESITERYKSGNRHSEEFKDWDGNYRRFVDFDTPEALEGFMKQYTDNVGEEIIHPAATSTTWRNTHAFFDKKDSLQIKVIPKEGETEGVLVDRFKNLADEAEILYPPGQKFKVVEIGETESEPATFGKFANEFDVPDFKAELVMNIMNLSEAEIAGNKYLTDLQKEIKFSIQDPEDIPFLGPTIINLSSQMDELEPPTIQEIMDSDIWVDKILPQDSPITDMFLEGKLRDNLTKKGRKQVVLQEV